MTQLSYGHDGEHAYSLYYEHSGKVTPTGLILGTAAGLAVGAAAGALYSLAVMNCPIIKLNALLAIAFGAAVGASAVSMMRVGKVRSIQVSIATVAVITFLSYYFSWVVWLWMLLRNSSVQIPFQSLLWRPDIVGRIILKVNEHGTWAMSTYDKQATSGITLWLVWLAEVGLIFGSSLICAKVLVKSKPFCERCNRWCTGPVSLQRFKAASAAEVRRHLESRDFAFFEQLGLATNQDAVALQLIHHHCPQCRDLHTLSVEQITTTASKKGQQKNTNLVVDKFLIAPEELQQIQAITLESQWARDEQRKAAGARARGIPQPPGNS
ncbi:MAG TPA: hypothetical protein VIL86_11325 [Tepidisphaeraceae bacterium]|jgi:hypothetical protein